MTATLPPVATTPALPDYDPARGFNEQVLDAVRGTYTDKHAFTCRVNAFCKHFPQHVPSFWGIPILMQYGYRTSRVGWINTNTVVVK